MTTSHFYPEAFVSEVLKLFPEDHEVHVALAWGDQEVIQKHLESRHHNQHWVIDGMDHTLSTEVFALDDGRKATLQILRDEMEAQKKHVTALIDQLYSMEKEVRSKTTLYKRGPKGGTVH